jgi:hypothetical protein
MGGGDYGIGYDRARVRSGRQSVWQLVTAVAEIALRRRGPDSLPDSSFLVFFLLGVYVVVALLVSAILVSGNTASSLARLAADTALFFAFVYAVLSFFKLERRYRQTMSAMLGADIVINLIFLPVGVAALALGFDILEPPFGWVSLVFYLWSVFIAASVLARSLSQPLLVGFMFEILFILTSLSIGDFLAPPAEQVAVESS